MGSLLFEIKDNKDELHRVVVSDIGSILTINDDFMTKQVMARKGIEKIKYCLIKPNVENLTWIMEHLQIQDCVMCHMKYSRLIKIICQSYGADVRNITTANLHGQKKEPSCGEKVIWKVMDSLCLKVESLLYTVMNVAVMN